MATSHGLSNKKAMVYLHPWLFACSKQNYARVHVSKVKTVKTASSFHGKNIIPNRMACQAK
jgi:hypothetical protein